jgi:hypothetical protein
VLPFLSILSAMMELAETGAPAEFEDPMSTLNARTALLPLFLGFSAWPRRQATDRPIEFNEFNPEFKVEFSM